jgi:choline dehydrogenase-like flavoprotein
MSDPSGPRLPRTWPAWCAAVLDLDPVAADRVASDLREFTRELPATTRMAMDCAMTAVDALSVRRTGHRLCVLDTASRSRLLGELPAGLVEMLKIPLLLVHGASGANDELLASATKAPPVRPDAELDVTPSAQWPSCTTADVVVVGSGAGGAMAARSLARAGLRTIVLEEGRRHAVEEFRTKPALERFTSLYRDGGATTTFGIPPVVLPLGRGVGGTTLVNSGTCYRTPERVLRRWRDEWGVDLATEWLDEVETLLQVAPVQDSVMGRNGQLALRGAANLGWSSHPLLRNAPGCGGCCQCAIGCPRNAKFGVHLNALPDACAAGARIVSHARVERLLHCGGRVSGVRARRPDRSVLEVLAPRVVVAAGATETPPLLRRSRLGHHPLLGRNLAIHPAVSTAGRFDEPVDPTSGVLQSVGIDELHEAEGILIEATSTPPGMGSMVLPGVGAELVEELAASRHLALLGAMVADAPAGRVLGSRAPFIRYTLTPADGRKLVRALGAMGRLLLSAGATEVLTGIGGHERAHTQSELDDALAQADPRRLHVAAFHPTGTARIGADPQTAPVDQLGRLRGVEGVWVADASVLPSCPEVNPQVTIMALALSIASNLLS